MKSRFFIAALIFIALAGTKLFFPEQAATMRTRILPAITRQAELREDLIHIGRAFAGQESSLLVWQRLTGQQEKKAASAPLMKNTEAPDPSPAAADGFAFSEMVRENLLGFSSFLSSSLPEPEAFAQKADEPEEAELLASAFPAPETLSPEYPPSQEALMQEKVDSFLEAQAAFAEHERPANVSYEAPIPGFAYSSPCDMPVTSNFGYRNHPLEEEVKFHYGTDLGAHEGCEIYAFADATVLSVSELEGYGLTVLLDHGEGFQSLYAHCSSQLVSQGDIVKRGDLIALAGQTGKVTGPHLHFELIYNGIYLNPEYYIR